MFQACVRGQICPCTHRVRDGPPHTTTPPSMTAGLLLGSQAPHLPGHPHTTRGHWTVYEGGGGGTVGQRHSLCLPDTSRTASVSTHAGPMLHWVGGAGFGTRPW